MHSITHSYARPPSARGSLSPVSSTQQDTSTCHTLNVSSAHHSDAPSAAPTQDSAHAREERTARTQRTIRPARAARTHRLPFREHTSRSHNGPGRSSFLTPRQAALNRRSPGAHTYSAAPGIAHRTPGAYVAVPIREPANARSGSRVRLFCVPAALKENARAESCARPSHGQAAH